MDRDEISAVKRLAQELKSGGYEPSKRISTQPTVEPIDTSHWIEFGDFFDRPMSSSQLWVFEEKSPPPYEIIKRVLPCGFISLVSNDRDKAIAGLRSELFKLRQSPAVIKAYLAKPSLLYLTEGVYKWTAFCFIHGYTIDPVDPTVYHVLDKDNLNHYLTTGVPEGALGPSFD